MVQWCYLNLFPTVIKNAFNPEGKYQDMRASDLQDVSANRCELALSKRCPRPRSGSVLGPTDCQPILCGEVGAFRLWVLSLGRHYQLGRPGTVAVSGQAGDQRHVRAVGGCLTTAPQGSRRRSRMSLMPASTAAAAREPHCATSPGLVPRGQSCPPCPQGLGPRAFTDISRDITLA